MKEHFEQQINESVALTQDAINRLKQARIDKLPLMFMDDEEKIAPRSSYGTKMVVGDKVLYFMTGGKVQSILLRELDKLNGYELVQMDNKIPIIKKP